MLVRLRMRLSSCGGRAWRCEKENTRVLPGGMKIMSAQKCPHRQETTDRPPSSREEVDEDEAAKGGKYATALASTDGGNGGSFSTIVLVYTKKEWDTSV